MTARAKGTRPAGIATRPGGTSPGGAPYIWWCDATPSPGGGGVPAFGMATETAGEDCAAVEMNGMAGCPESAAAGRCTGGASAFMFSGSCARESAASVGKGDGAEKSACDAAKDSAEFGSEDDDEDGARGLLPIEPAAFVRRVSVGFTMSSCSVLSCDRRDCGLTIWSRGRPKEESKCE